MEVVCGQAQKKSTFRRRTEALNVCELNARKRQQKRKFSLFNFKFKVTTVKQQVLNSINFNAHISTSFLLVLVVSARIKLEE